MLVPYPLCVMTFAALTAQTLNVSDIFYCYLLLLTFSSCVNILC